MDTVRRPDRTPQDSDRENLTEAAAGIIAGLLADDPTAQDARAAARAWLRRWEVARPLRTAEVRR